MAKQRYKPEDIILKLREIEIHQGNGMDVSTACRPAGITDATYYRRRKEYGVMKVDQAKKYKELEHENTRLKKLVAQLIGAGQGSVYTHSKSQEFIESKDTCWIKARLITC